jgi:hypothetical protein
MNGFLQRVRMHGDWGAWLHWVLRGVEATAGAAASRASELMAMRERYRALSSARHTAARMIRMIDVS